MSPLKFYAHDDVQNDTNGKIKQKFVTSFGNQTLSSASVSETLKYILKGVHLF